ncbi:MAG: hypothetical protein QF879_14850 [Candidatus Latescibacteria bacterium]|nr:hypothetical protein [Candidatus Latescibacterota bacterium]
MPDEEVHQETGSFGGFTRTAELIGQRGDPNHLGKLPVLYGEFEELGTNEKTGYTGPIETWGRIMLDFIGVGYQRWD